MSSVVAGGKRTLFRCSYCHKDVTTSFRVQCAVCVDFYLCTDCFSAGVSLNPHQSTHDYMVADCLEIPIFEKGWTINEELILLDAIEKYGVGNWKTISENVLSNKTTRQVEEHYWETYMGVHGYCLPTKTILNDGTVVDTASFFPEDNATSSSAVVKDENGSPEEKNSAEVYEDAATAPNNKNLHRTKVIEPYTLGEVVRRDIGKEVSTKGNKIEVKDKATPLPGSDLPGYIPLREDFDVEFENDAEDMLADMEFTPDDHPSERELKLQVIGIYNKRLDERDRRKRFVIDRGLIDSKQQQLLDRKRTKDERELVGKLRVFARFHSQAEHEALVDGVLKARKLRQQIDLYKHYRQMGIKTLDQARQYEQDRKIRERDAKLKKQMGREVNPYLLESSRSTNNSSSSAWPESIPLLPPHGNSGRRASAGVAAAVNVDDGFHGSVSGSQLSSIGDNLASKSAAAGNKRKSRGDLAELAVEVEEAPKDPEAPIKRGPGRRKKILPGAQTDASAAAPVVKAATEVVVESVAVVQPVQARPGPNYGVRPPRAEVPIVRSANGNIVTPEDLSIISNAPGGNLLATKEVELCARVPMLPLHYLAAKEAIVREAYRNGTLTKDGINRVLKMEPKQRTVIYDFFVKEMLLNKPPVRDGSGGALGTSRSNNSLEQEDGAMLE